MGKRRGSRRPHFVFRPGIGTLAAPSRPVAVPRYTAAMPQPATQPDLARALHAANDAYRALHGSDAVPSTDAVERLAEAPRGLEEIAVAVTRER